MKRAAGIIILIYCSFWIESFLHNVFGIWGKPELMLLVVVFCNLYWGIRHSIGAAVVCGILKDASSADTFGIFLLLYVAAAYLTTLIRQMLYQPGSRFSRALVTFLVLIGVFIIEVVVHMCFLEFRMTDAVRHIFVPRLVLTMIVATRVFHGLRDIVVRFKF